MPRRYPPAPVRHASAPVRHASAVPRSALGLVDVLGDLGLLRAGLAGALALVDVQVADPVVAAARVVGPLDRGLLICLVAAIVIGGHRACSLRGGVPFTYPPGRGR